MFLLNLWKYSKNFRISLSGIFQIGISCVLFPALPFCISKYLLGLFLCQKFYKHKHNALRGFLLFILLYRWENWVSLIILRLHSRKVTKLGILCNPGNLTSGLIFKLYTTLSLPISCQVIMMLNICLLLTDWTKL